MIRNTSPFQTAFIHIAMIQSWKTIHNDNENKYFHICSDKNILETLVPTYLPLFFIMFRWLQPFMENKTNI